VRTTLSLPLRLVFLVAGTTLPLIIFAAAIVYLNYQADRKEASARILEITRSMMLVVDRELQSTTAALRVLALSLALQRDDFKAFRQQAESFLRDYPEGANLMLADRSGQQLLNMAMPEGDPLPVRVNLESLKTVFETGRPVVTDLFVGAVLKRPLVAFDVPVLRNGDVVYVLSFNPPLDVFTEIIRRQQPTPGWSSRCSTAPASTSRARPIPNDSSDSARRPRSTRRSWRSRKRWWRRYHWRAPRCSAPSAVRRARAGVSQWASHDGRLRSRCGVRSG
jgi:hypothetical protein